MSSRTHRVNPRPRSTANRNLYTGDTRGLRAPGSGPRALPPGTEGAVLCERCDTWVRALPEGQPMSHAYGGYGTNTRAGHPPCEGSGTYASEPAHEVPRFPEHEARARRLVTVGQLARKYGVSKYQVTRALKAGSVQAVGTLESGPGAPRLYRVEPAVRALAEYRLIGRAS